MLLARPSRLNRLALTKIRSTGRAGRSRQGNLFLGHRRRRTPRYKTLQKTLTSPTHLPSFLRPTPVLTLPTAAPPRSRAAPVVEEWSLSRRTGLLLIRLTAGVRLSS